MGPGFAGEISNSTEAKEFENDVQFRVGVNGILDSKNREDILVGKTFVYGTYFHGNAVNSLSDFEFGSLAG